MMTTTHIMNQRLLSLLSQVEHALRQTDIEATHHLRASRSVDYRQGTARLAFEQADGTMWGAAEVQGYRLANGESCLKVTVGPAGAGLRRSHSIFPREGCDWTVEAGKIARSWLEAMATEPALHEAARAVG